MFKKYLVVASKKDKAGINITTQLSQFRPNPLMSSMKDTPNFDFYLIEDEAIYTENLNPEKLNQYDFIIFASKHESSKKEKTLSVHAPGNFGTADFGGEVGKVCKASALLQKYMFEKLNSYTEKYELKDYKVTLECTHHGPLIDKPCVFIEIGATETEWNDRRAAFIISKTISDVVESFKENPYREVGIGIGGPHYCPNFTRLQLKSNVAFAHIIPQYALPVTKDMIIEAWNKTVEEPDFVVLDWKGIKSEQRQKILEIIEELKLPWKRSSEVGK